MVTRRILQLMRLRRQKLFVPNMLMCKTKSGINSSRKSKHSDELGFWLSMNLVVSLRFTSQLKMGV